MRRLSTRSTVGVILSTVLLTACADVPHTLLSPDLTGPSAAFQHLSEWSPATALTEINTVTATEGCPFVTKSGDVLYFASNRVGGFGALDLYVSRWNEEAQAWSEPINLGAGINTAGNEQCPLVLTAARSWSSSATAPMGRAASTSGSRPAMSIGTISPGNPR